MFTLRLSPLPKRFLPKPHRPVRLDPEGNLGSSPTNHPYQNADEQNKKAVPSEPNADKKIRSLGG